MTRYEAIDILKNTIVRFERTNGKTVYAEALQMAIKALEEPQWIPCSERLPENDKSVLATTAWGEVTIAERIYPPINDTCWFIHDGNTNATIDDVIAWMPLPEPYEGGNDV